MVKKLFTILIFTVFSICGYTQRNSSAIIDTVETKNGMVVLYRNFSWEYLENEPVMMSQEDDSTGLFSHEWINDQIFAYNTKRDSIRDTTLYLLAAGKTFILPVYGKLFRGFTYTHKGLDIKLCTGDTVKAAFDGVVRYARRNKGGFGNLIVIRHYNGLETYYAHNSKLLIKVNQVVKAGDPISLGGSTGRSRGPHCHFEVRYKDFPLDPLRMIDFENKKLISCTFPVTKKVFYPNDYDVNAVYHKIKSGDTIGALARKYRTSVKEICAMNRISAKKNLKIGQTIRVR